MTFQTQRLLSIMVLLFCFAQVFFDNSDKSTAWSVISSIVGYWLPSPIEQEKKK